MAGYVQLFQGTPLLMQLFLAYFGLALFGFDTSAWFAAAAARTLYSSAFLVEISHGCVRSVPKGQWEAAQSLALSFGEQLPYVIFLRRSAWPWRPASDFWCRSSKARHWLRSLDLLS